MNAKFELTTHNGNLPLKWGVNLHKKDMTVKVVHGCHKRISQPASVYMRKIINYGGCWMFYHETDA